MKRLVILLTMALSLGGCPPTPPTFKTITLSPSQLDAPQESQWSSNAVCGIVPVGHGLVPAPRGGTFTGYSDVYFEGPQPFPCEYEQQNQYRGHVAFDLSKFDQIAGATLVIGVISSVSSPPSAGFGSSTQQDNPGQSYATTLGMAFGTKDEGQGPYYWDFLNPVSMPSCTSAMFVPCSVDVTPQAKLWVSRIFPNLGFILAGPVIDFPGNLPQDNAEQLSTYGGFRLQVLYNPALNPRAPQ